MTSLSFFNHDAAQLNIILELLNRTQGMEFAVLAHKHTNDNHYHHKHAAGKLPPSGSASGKTVTHKAARLQAYTEQQFLTDEAVKNLIFNAFFSGHLGIKDENKRYAFNTERNNELKEAGIKTIIVTNAPNEEQIEQEATFDTISDELYLMLLEQLLEINETTKGKQEKTKNIETTKRINAPSSQKSAASQMRSNSSKVSHSKKQESIEEINENSRADKREKVKNALKKDQLASEKIKKYISFERLKEEIKNTAFYQELIKKGEIDEMSLFKTLEKAEISESTLNKLLEIGEVNKDLFIQLLKKTETDKLVKKINNAHKKLII